MECLGLDYRLGFLLLYSDQGTTCRNVKCWRLVDHQCSCYLKSLLVVFRGFCLFCLEESNIFHFINHAVGQNTDGYSRELERGIEGKKSIIKRRSKREKSRLMGFWQACFAFLFIVVDVGNSIPCSYNFLIF